MDKHILFLWDDGTYISTVDETFKEAFAELVVAHGLPDQHDVRPGDFYGNPMYWTPYRDAQGNEAFLPIIPTVEHVAEPEAVEEVPETHKQMKERLRAAFKHNLKQKRLIG